MNVSFHFRALNYGTMDSFLNFFQGKMWTIINHLSSNSKAAINAKKVVLIAALIFAGFVVCTLVLKLTNEWRDRKKLESRNHPVALQEFRNRCGDIKDELDQAQSAKLVVSLTQNGVAWKNSHIIVDNGGMQINGHVFPMRNNNLTQDGLIALVDQGLKKAQAEIHKDEKTDVKIGYLLKNNDHSIKGAIIEFSIQDGQTFNSGRESTDLNSFCALMNLNEAPQINAQGEFI